MDVTDILPQIDRLDRELDTLDDALKPLLGSVSDVASKLPLLDKAKLYVLVTYAIESMLFSSLRLNAVDAKNHPVFKELTRVRQYFEKIKNIESPPEVAAPRKPEQTLNKEAAIRFLRSDLADNKEVNTKLTEMIAKERAKAALKAAQQQKQKQQKKGSGSGSGSSKRKAGGGGEEKEESEKESEDVIRLDSQATTTEPPAKKSRKRERKEKKAKKDSK
ncbi:putative sas10 utp3 c1d protein [Eutypa lata UCREL1]|uniref:Exosome complex protein n=1 Tax=Eutypa lata (strain UCR-EL1) TaxID=1287681 RepID=M7TLA3_EUTLA|nr:putative sas10 utp3 c1d protein [Eutypa lata UCREL1]